MNKEYEEVIRKRIIEYTANVIARSDDQRTYHVTLVLGMWVFTIVGTLWLHMLCNDNPNIPDFNVLVFHGMCGVAILMMFGTFFFFNRMDCRWFLYHALLAMSMSLVITSHEALNTFEILDDRKVLFVFGYLFLSYLTMRISRKRFINSIKKIPQEDDVPLVVLPLGLYIVGGLFILIPVRYNLFAVPDQLLLIWSFPVPIAINYFAGAMLTMYRFGRRCNIPQEMMFKEEYATIKKSNGKDTEE